MKIFFLFLLGLTALALADENAQAGKSHLFDEPYYESFCL